MPRRSDRKDYAHAFTDNPHAGKNPHELYKTLRWGDEARECWNIEGPEHMATLGELAALRYADRAVERWHEDEAPFLAVGLESNYLWIVPRLEDGSPIASIPQGPYMEWGAVKQTDYYSTKNGEDAYYYHKHERPYPILFVHESSGTRVLLPAEHKGARSYAVIAEGIVG